MANNRLSLVLDLVYVSDYPSLNDTLPELTTRGRVLSHATTLMAILPGRFPTDVVMPRMGGTKLAGCLATERPSMKVLFVSGYAEHKVLRHGPIDVTARFLQKPFSLKALARKIRDVLDADELVPVASAAEAAAAAASFS
jgi:FixJ family two-component response regulator